MEDVSALVARQYEAFPYPPPSYDLAQTIAEGGYQFGDPTLWEPMLWPEGRPREELNILVAGCGTMQAAWFAFTNRGCAVTGVDLSEESLAHQRFLQDKHGLKNLRLFKGDLRDVDELRGMFDLVICTGVLHHMASPDEGMGALARVMQPRATLACMLYGATGRTGVYMLQDAFRRLGVQADGEGVAVVRQTLASLPASHFVRQFVQMAGELRHDAALIDTFLHPQDRAYTAPQVLNLVEANGLFFQGWFDNAVYYSEGIDWLPPEVAERLAALPAREQWAVVEMLNPTNDRHYFFARNDEPPELSFASPDRLAPQRRPGLSNKGPNRYGRVGRTLTLSPEDARVFEGADGSRTIAELGDTRGLFERLWKQGHVMVSKR